MSKNIGRGHNLSLLLSKEYKSISYYYLFLLSKSCVTMSFKQLIQKEMVVVRDKGSVILDCLAASVKIKTWVIFRDKVK